MGFLEFQIKAIDFFRFQNRRTKWKKSENISNAEVAEHKLGTRKMSSSSSLDHNQKHNTQLPISDSTCSSTSSDEQIYHTSTLSSLPLLYFNPFTDLIRPSLTMNERSCSPINDDRDDQKVNCVSDSR